jgi:hypothetical protein
MQSYDLGRVFSRLHKMVRANFAAVAGLVLIAAGIGFVIRILSMGSMVSTWGKMVQTGMNTESLKEMVVASQAAQASPLYWIGNLIAGAVGCAVLAGCTDACLRSNRGEVTNFSTSLRAGLQFCLPVLGFLLLYGLALGVAMIPAFIIGALVSGGLGVFIGLFSILALVTLWSVAVPAMINEGTGVFGAFGRSMALTSGNRLMIFLTYFLWTLMLIVMFAVIGGILAVVAIVFTKISPFLLVLLIVPYLAIIIIYRLFSVGAMSSVYAELREIKDGGDNSLTDVFA